MSQLLWESREVGNLTVRASESREVLASRKSRVSSKLHKFVLYMLDLSLQLIKKVYR
jgi:hypothetical protein